MPILRTDDKTLPPQVVDWESMLRLIRRFGILPFFSNPIPGYSVEEHTAPEFWFTEESLGPWDWKIDCVQSGDIVYGKYLWGGKAAATVEVYRELMNWRRSLPKYAPTPLQQQVLDAMGAQGSITVGEVRHLLGVKKAAADAILSKLQMQTRVITGDITRVYRGPDLHYSGWQRSSFCAPEALFEDLDFPFPGFTPRTMKSSLTPGQSLEYLMDTVRAAVGPVSDRLLLKMLG